MSEEWPIRLFNKSVLKQRKLREISEMLGPSRNLHCLDIGSDNGVVSLLLRRKGGFWTSADLSQEAVQMIQALVKEKVYQLDGRQTPFQENQFDRVILIDFLEHIHTEEIFVIELYRILKPGGELIINVPHIKNTFLRKFRLYLGQTDEKHGHVRPGYTADALESLLGERFRLISAKTYSKFFSECIDTLMAFAFEKLKKDKASSSKGLLVGGEDLRKHEKAFRMYSLIYPIVWFFAKLDNLLFWTSGYMLIAKAKTTKKF
jgi:ubiquinone/menaquinone biosynthesis C-methylase UbiE